MNWLAILQILLNGVLGYWALHLSVYPLPNETKKSKPITLVIILFILAACVAYFQSKETDKAQDKFNKVQGGISESQEKLDRKLAEVSSKLGEIDGLRRQYGTLVDNILTNNSLSTEGRQAALASDMKFQELNSQSDDVSNWLASASAAYRDRIVSRRLQVQSQRAKDFVPIASDYVTYYRYFAYFMESFTNMLTKIAASKGDEIESQYKGLPRSITVNDNADQIAEFNFKKNENWRFTVVFYPSELTLTVNCAGSHLAVRRSGDGEIIVPGVDLYHFSYTTNDYQKGIDAQLRFLLASRESAPANTNAASKRK